MPPRELECPPRKSGKADAKIDISTQSASISDSARLPGQNYSLICEEPEPSTLILIRSDRWRLADFTRPFMLGSLVPACSLSSSEAGLRVLIPGDGFAKIRIKQKPRDPKRSGMHAIAHSPSRHFRFGFRGNAVPFSRAKPAKEA